jgi:hypothetical protein
MAPVFIAGETAPTVAEQPPGPPPKPKLRRPERRDNPDHWFDMLPATLAEQVADSEQLAAHGKLVERVQRGAAKVRELEAAHRQAVEQDRQAEIDFAAGKARKLAAPLGPDAEAAVEQARRELGLLEAELPKSANELFDAAYPQAERALAELERQLAADDDAIEAAVGEALRVLDERAQLARERGWLSQVLWESLVSPFDARRRATSNSKTAAELRAVSAGLRHEREEAKRRRREQEIERVMLFNEDRSPKRRLAASEANLIATWAGFHGPGHRG